MVGSYSVKWGEGGLHPEGDERPFIEPVMWALMRRNFHLRARRGSHQESGKPTAPSVGFSPRPRRLANAGKIWFRDLHREAQVLRFRPLANGIFFLFSTKK